LAAAYGLAPLSPSAAVSTFAQIYGDTLIQRTVKGLLKGLHWVMGDDRPLGMSEEEFLEAKARHEAGELTLGEVQQLRERVEAAHAAAQAAARAEARAAAYAGDGDEAGDALPESERDIPLSRRTWPASFGHHIEP
jgi:hypothetical protein